MQTLRVGVVGVGARGRLAWHAEAHDAVIVGICDPHPQRARARLARDVPVVATVAELTALGIDVAFVTSPDDTHAAVTTQLLHAGVAVYLEKPLAITLPDATAVLQAAYDSGSRLYVGHNMRHMQVVRLMRQLIQQGEIGSVQAIWCRHFVGSGGDFYFKDWHADRRHVGGLLLQKGAHDIDVMHWLADSATTRVSAMGRLAVYGQITDRRDNSAQLMPQWHSLDNWPPLAQRGLHPVIDVEDLSHVLLQLGSGVLATYQQCHFTPDYWRNYTVIGTRGRLENFGDGPGGEVRVWKTRGYYEPADEVHPITESGTGHASADALTVAEFFRFVRDGGATDTSPVGAWQAVAAAICATDSLRSGSQPREVPALAPHLVQYFAAGQRRC
ncbi:gfo/Idh/MocA family oxidoreductase [Buchananella hordeovulneris]|uniref:Gfo/Idh/MocA family protein n=1 Tax=Buchananella hordeovulneris TaxID=52770 RepID=UPI000F5E6D24|nr:Gfo/Idh/MocA family oxidoreductase [Buchananella hordeovulneris]RRD52472.1 gfo/Idh/MocA family oxidoreductase [Buchananella hordeovulneris]